MMPSYGSSDDASDDEIGVPKTPAVVTNHSDESNDSESDDSDSSHSDGSDNAKSKHRNRSSPRASSSDGSEAENRNSDSESEVDRKEANKKHRADRNNENLQEDDNSSEDEKKSSLSSDNESQKQSDDNDTKSPKKRKRSDSSDEESDQDVANKDKNPDANELFGDLSDEDEDEKEEEEEEGDTKRMRFGEFGKNDEANEDEARNQTTIRDIFGEDEGEGDADQREVETEETETEMNQVDPPKPIYADVPRIVPDLGEELHFVKLPNFLSVETHPYDPQWYEDEVDDDEMLDEEGRARLKLKVENTIRWRNVTDEDGDVTRQSNARIVKWSDGSKSLHLGDEIFDIQTLNLLPGEHNHLFIRQGVGLQGQTIFKTKITFRPFSTESFTHRKLTLSLADRSQKTQKICVLPSVGKDPEAHRSEMIKKEEVKLKASIRKESKQRRNKDRVYTRGPFNSYLEGDDEDDESISIAKIKNQYKRGNAYSSQRYTDSDDSDDDDNDDSDLDIFDKKKPTEKKKIVVSDEDDDD